MRNPEVAGSRERLTRLGDVDGCAVVEARVEALEHRLRRQVELIEDHLPNKASGLRQ